MLNRTTFVIAAAVACSVQASAQQVPDRSYRPAVTAPAYADGKGPRVCLDEGHTNFHTLDQRFWAFGDLVRRDGYVVEPLRAKFTAGSLARCRVLVIANAQPNADPWNTYPYPTPPAFTPAEVTATRRWVRGGGSLLLIADHMPLAGAAASLASAFGVTFNDGFAVEGYGPDSARAASFAKPTIFSLRDSTLRSHRIVRGRNAAEAVTSVRSFTGQAFTAPASAEAVMVVPPTFISLMPRTAWVFDDGTKRVPVGGWLQGAVMRVGTGRVAFFGEAAMFSAQIAGAERRPMGMNAPGAEQNHQFVLNVLHWLSGIL